MKPITTSMKLSPTPLQPTATFARPAPSSVKPGATFVLLFCLLATSLVAVSPAARADGRPGGWERVSNSGGVIVDRREVPGSSLKEFRGQAVLDVPLIALLAVFSDIPHATEWMDQCRASSLVEDRGDVTKVVYNRTHAPWPVSDRDAVLLNQVFFDRGARRIRLEFHSVPHAAVPPQRGVVRMPALRGHWYLWPEGPERTRVEYQVFANPGGSLPDWVVNYVSRELPRKTILALRAQAKRRAHPEAEKYIRGLALYRQVAEAIPAVASAQ